MPSYRPINAVLRSIDPGLTVDELEAALELGAVDLGLAGPDNTFGVGRLDLFVSAQIVLGGADRPIVKIEATDAEIVDFTRAVAKVAALVGVAESAGGDGFRILSNAGPDAHQEVPHLHVHVFGGKFLGRMIKVPD